MKRILLGAALLLVAQSEAWAGQLGGSGLTVSKIFLDMTR